AGAAALLVPTWSRLDSTRTMYLLLTTGIVGLTAWLLDLVSARCKLAVLVAATATSFCIAAAASYEVSLQFGQTMLLMAAGLSGILLAVWRRRDLSVCGVGLPYALAAGGVSMFAYLQFTTPLRGMLLLPLAPLVIVLGQIVRLPGRGG